MSTPAQIGLARWYEVVATMDPEGLPEIIAADGIFRSPALFKPEEGRDQVVKYLTAAFRVLGPHFAYHDEWIGVRDAVLRLTSRIGGKEIEGIDMIRWDDDGQITEFTVMIRPLSALQAVMTSMAEQLLT